ncbi:ABC-type amino acid transport substrate-binding protein [Pseudomonas psychrotolerans]|nr:ABC-type amino acid transport substrate-binding protein [Pseudomonas psychrotolerans]
MKKSWLTLSALALCLAAGSAMAKEWKEIRFGVDTTYPPFESQAADGSFVGFDIELGNAICEKLKVQCKWIVSDFDGLIPGLRARKFDGILSSLTKTPARAEQIDFSDLMWSGPSSMVTKEGSNLQATAESLKGKTVGVQQGTIQETFAKQKLARPTASTSRATRTRIRSTPTWYRVVSTSPCRTCCRRRTAS